MRILQVTAGAANMYCGSCLRDNALATELKRQGHDVVLMPVYTPTLTDTENVSEDRVFFGGISVYLQQKSAIFRHTPAFLDRLLFDNNWALRKASQRSIGVDPQFLGEMTVDMLKGEHGPIAKEFRKMADWLEGEPKFDVINIPFTLLIAMAAPLKRASGGARLVCTLQGEDLFLEGLQQPYKSESLELIQRSVKDVDTFIAVSGYYADFMSKYLQIPRDKIRTVPIGIDLRGFERAAKPVRDHVQIGFFARVDPAKGLHYLVESYKMLRKRPNLPKMKLEVAGYMLPEHKGYYEEVRKSIEVAGLGSEFTYHGSVPREQKIRFLQDVDLLCVPTQYAEPKGIFAIEAMACGTPVILPAHGAFPEVLGRTGGGVLVQPENTAELADTLEELVRNPERRAALGDAGAEGVRNFYSAQAMAAATLAAYA